MSDSGYNSEIDRELSGVIRYSSSHDHWYYKDYKPDVPDSIDPAAIPHVSAKPFEKALKRSKGDVTPWLVFADYLEDGGREAEAGVIRHVVNGGQWHLTDFGSPRKNSTFPLIVNTYSPPPATNLIPVPKSHEVPAGYSYGYSLSLHAPSGRLVYHGPNSSDYPLFTPEEARLASDVYLGLSLNDDYPPEYLDREPGRLPPKTAALARAVLRSRRPDGRDFDYNAVRPFLEELSKHPMTDQIAAVNWVRERRRRLP